MKIKKHIITLTILCITILFYIFAYTNIDQVPIVKTIENNVKSYEEIKENTETDFTLATEVKEETSQVNQSSTKIESNVIDLERPNPIIVEENDLNIEIIKNDKTKLGTLGRLYFPSLNHSVALFHASLYDENLNAQVIVDNKDSAAHFSLGDSFVIADHNYQGFKKIINLNIGDKAYIKKCDGSIMIYKLNNKFIGENIKTDLISKEGTSVQKMEADLIMYTCYNTGNDIMITLWDLESI